MAIYESDRRFTDKVHKNLALVKIYRGMGWVEQQLDDDVRERIDMNDAIDYVCVDKHSGQIVTIQERFRDDYYKFYNDFTLRFERENNSHEERKLSEFYKLHVDYLVYGITNASKVNVDKATDFVKYIVVDIKKFNALVESGVIVIERDRNIGTSRMRGDKIYCPVIYNRDGSSSFVPIEAKMFNKVCPNGVVIQKGML